AGWRTTPPGLQTLCSKAIVMNNRLNRILRDAFGASVLLAATTLARAAVTDYVKPLIGTADHGHTFPGATVPFGMVQLSPDTRDGSDDDAYQNGAAGYHYSDTSIMGFSHNHLTGTGIGDLGNVLLMPTVGELKLVAGKQPGQGYRARFSHDQEEARPGYYRVFLPDYKLNVELTATAPAGPHPYTFPQAAGGHISLGLRPGSRRGRRQDLLLCSRILPPLRWRRTDFRP